VKVNLSLITKPTRIVVDCISGPDLPEFPRRPNPLGRSLLLVFFAPRASPFLSIPTRCTGSHFIFFLFLAVRRRKRSERKNEKEKEILRTNEEQAERTGRGASMTENRGGEREKERERVEDRQRRTSVPRSRRLRRRYL